MREEKGITLIALVLTIIVLLILAGVSIAMLTDESRMGTQENVKEVENRIKEQTKVEEQKKVKQESRDTQIKEAVNIASLMLMANKVDVIANPDPENNVPTDITYDTIAQQVKANNEDSQATKIDGGISYQYEGKTYSVTFVFVNKEGKELTNGEGAIGVKLSSIQIKEIEATNLTTNDTDNTNNTNNTSNSNDTAPEVQE